MKRKRLFSYLLSLVMAITVFSIPTGAFAEETDYALGWQIYDEAQDDYDLKLVRDGGTVNYEDLEWNCLDFYYIEEGGSWETTTPEKVVWHNQNPELVMFEYNSWDEELDESTTIKSRESEVEVGGYEAMSFVPIKEGSAQLSAEVTFWDPTSGETATKTIAFTLEIKDSDITHYRLGWYDYDSGEPAFVGTDPVDSEKYNGNPIEVFSGSDGDWESVYEGKFVWHNSNPSVVKLGVFDENTGECVIPENQEITASQVYLSLQNVGTAEFTVYIYQSPTDSEPIATIPFVVEVSQKALDKFKYSQFVDMVGVHTANYDTKKLTGSIPSLKDYKDWITGAMPVLTTEDLKNLQITATVAGKDYTATINQKNNEFTIKVPGVKLGAKATVTIKMGTYTRKDSIIFSKTIKPTVTVKNYVYNGKKHKAAPVVKYGKTVFKANVDYGFDSAAGKDVGRYHYEIWTGDNNKYNFYKEGYFKINPKGTSLKKLKKAKKAITVKWNKQAAKMSKTRITGYQIQLATNSKFTKGKKLVTVKGYAATSKKIKKLKKKKKYFVRIRTYKKVGKITYYSGWSKAKSVKTK